MKKLIVIAALVIFAGVSNKVMAQTIASSTAGAEIMTPITLTNNVGLEFGKMAVQLATGGTVVLTAAAAPTATPANGVTLMTGTTRTAAKYTVGGTASYIYTITVPQVPVTITKGGGVNMTITAFSFASIATPSLTGGTLTVGGTDVFYVGGTLNVAAGQAAGAYTGNFDVTVNYN